MTEPKHSRNVTGERLKSFIERVERLNEEKAALSEDIKEVFAEAKGTGFDVKILRKIIRRRGAGPEKIAEEEELIDLYEAAISGDQLDLLVKKKDNGNAEKAA